jgi:hypothetical protein
LLKLATIKVSAVTVGILQILSFEGFVRNVWGNWLIFNTGSVFANISYKFHQNLEFTYAKFLLWSQKLW